MNVKGGLFGKGTSRKREAKREVIGSDYDLSTLYSHIKIVNKTH
jgi:hypothetical protein